MITIRDVREEDSDELFTWRNDPISRSMSLSSDIVNRTVHDNWFRKSLNNPNRIIYIGMKDQDKIGVVRFDLVIEQKTAEISINLNPCMRSKGLSSLLLNAAINCFIKMYPDYIFTAIIKNTNIASISLFVKNGFELDVHCAEYSHYIYRRSI